LETDRAVGCLAICAAARSYFRASARAGATRPASVAAFAEAGAFAFTAALGAGALVVRTGAAARDALARGRARSWTLPVLPAHQGERSHPEQQCHGRGRDKPGREAAGREGRHGWLRLDGDSVRRDSRSAPRVGRPSCRGLALSSRRRPDRRGRRCVVPRDAALAAPARAEHRDQRFLERLPCLGRRLRSLAGDLLHEPGNPVRNPHWDTRRHVAQVRDGLVDLAQHDRHRLLGVAERRTADQHLERGHADGVEIGPRPELACHRLLGRDVVGGAHRQAGRGLERVPLERVRRLRDAEVCDLHLTLEGDEKVLGLDVAVDDSVALRVREARKDSFQGAAGLRQGQAAHVAAQRPAREVLHRDVRHTVLLEVLMDRDDVRVVKELESRASRRNRRADVGSGSRNARSSFSATGRSRSSCRAR